MHSQNGARILALCALIVIFSGCTHNFLRRNTARQASTVSDVLYQQVMDNMATFCASPGALPHFAVLSDGTTQTTDQATPMGGLKWNATTITEETLGINANRQLMENWKMAPVTSAGRLKRLQCAFQFVVSPPSFAVEEVVIKVNDEPTPWYAIADDQCANCLAELTKMQLFPKPNGELIATGEIVFKNGRYYFKTVKLADDYATALRSALECHFPSGWYCCSTQKPPKNACYIGRCGKTYAWVMPGGIDELSRFSITLLTLATLDPLPASFVTVKRLVKGPTGEYMVVEGQVPGDVINFQLPRLIPTIALRVAAQELIKELVVPGNENAMMEFQGPDGPKEKGQLESLLKKVASDPTLPPENAAALRTLLDRLDAKARKFSAESQPSLSPEAIARIADVKMQLDMSPIHVPSEPSLLDQPGYMPFFNSAAGAEFVPQAQ